MNQLTIGTHREENIRQLKSTRRYAHRVFDRLWKTYYQRAQAYLWLAKQMGIADRHCHFSEFNLAQCYEAIRLIQELKPVIAERDPSEKRFQRKRREPNVQSN